jgi:hypothetical protein
MWAILLSGVWTALGWVFRAIVFKGVLYIALFIFCSEAMAYFAQVVSPDMMGLSQAFSNLGPGAGWFIAVTMMNVGLPMILSAYVLRFAIRRLPIIG